MLENQIVYVLTNPAMPDIVKIGKTTQSDIAIRMSQLYSTGVPLPFECVYAVEVEDCSKVEIALHIAFGPYRINPKREFFRIDPEQAIAVLKLLEKKDVSKEVNEDLNMGVSDAEKISAKNAQRRPNMNFEQMNIPFGSELVFVDDETIKVEVVSDRKIKYNNEIMSLTKATRLILELDYAVQPARHWLYKGKSISEIYEETYAQEEDIICMKLAL